MNSLERASCARGFATNFAASISCVVAQDPIRMRTLAALAVLAFPAFAEEGKPVPAAKQVGQRIQIGSQAPALSVTKWVKGEPVAALEKGKVYLVEFWATWCAPCIGSMPHLTELQAKYADRGLVVIGVTVADTRGNTLENVEAMVRQKGDVLGYRVAWDESQATWTNYMQAASKSSIPCSFLVDRTGRIAYIDHPDRIDATLELVLDGKHDLDKLAANAARQAALDSQASRFTAQLNQARAQSDWAKAIAAADGLIALESDRHRTNGAIAKFQVLAMNLKERDKAVEFAKSFFDGPGRNYWNVRSMIGGMIVEPTLGFDQVHADYALSLVQEAVKASNGENASVLYTLGRVYSLRGDAKAALEAVERAAKADPSFAPHVETFRKAAQAAETKQ